jgi:hypothetical protein
MTSGSPTGALWPGRGLVMVTDGAPAAGVADRPMLQARLVASRRPMTVIIRLVEITGWGIALLFIGCDMVC